METKKIKLLITEPVSDMAGVSIYILQMIKGIPKDRFDIHFAGPAGPLLNELKKIGVIIHQINTDYSVRNFFIQVMRMRVFLKKESFDILFSHTLKSGLLGLFISRGFLIKKVYLGHGWRYLQKKNFFSKLFFYILDWFVVYFSDFTFVLSDLEYNQGISSGVLTKERSAIARYSFNNKSFLQDYSLDSSKLLSKYLIDKSFPIIGMIGRVTDQKDPLLFIKIAEEIIKEFSKIQFVWVGDGVLYSQIKEIIKEKKLLKNIFLVGDQDQKSVPVWLSVFNIFLFTSKFEGLPISILEAMSAKKTIVAVSVGSISDVIHDKQTGFTFSPGNIKQAVNILKNIILNNNEKYGENAFEYIMKYHVPESRLGENIAKIFSSFSY